MAQFGSAPDWGSGGRGFKSRPPDARNGQPTQSGRAGRIVVVSDASEGQAASRPRGKSKRGYFLPGVIALAALLAIATAFGGGDLYHQPPSSLAGPDVASQIALAIQAEKNIVSAPSVTCPANEPVRAGLVFYCVETPSGNGPPVTVTVRETDQRGNLSWTLPSSR